MASKSSDKPSNKLIKMKDPVNGKVYNLMRKPAFKPINDLDKKQKYV